ncbi:MAG: hypothetical protein MUE96_03070 [Bacteroidia bacterium]|jgi:hypothetical protein|nr:hypothetical protein [Bacteroidia bacterium]
MKTFSKLFFVSFVIVFFPINASSFWFNLRSNKASSDPKILGCKNWESVGIISSDSVLANAQSLGLVMGQATGKSDKTSLLLLQSIQIQAAMIGGNYIRLMPILAPEKKAILTQYAEVLITNKPTLQQIESGEYEVRGIYEYHRTEANRNYPKKIDDLPSSLTINKELIKEEKNGILNIPLKIYGVPYLIFSYQIISASESSIVLTAKVQRGSRIILYNIFLQKTNS